MAYQYLVMVLKVVGLGLDFRNWITAMYGGIRSTVHINGYLSEPFSIKHLVCQECLLSTLLYALALEPLLQKWENFGDVPNELGCGKSVSTYVNDVTISMSEAQLPCVEDALKRYKVVAVTKINKNKTIDLQFSSWRAKSIMFSVMGHWTEGLVKLLGVWLGSDLQAKK